MFQPGLRPARKTRQVKATLLDKRPSRQKGRRAVNLPVILIAVERQDKKHSELLNVRFYK